MESHSRYTEDIKAESGTFGNTKCVSCLLNPHREKAAIFLGINKVIAGALERERNNNNISSPTTTYPCSVLNIFECPYKRKNKEVDGKKKNKKDKQILMLMSFSIYQKLHFN
jgi:hypothetical protein